VVCENLKQYLEAAQIYEKAENFEKAATLYLQLKMFKQAAPIMDKVTSKSIQIKYGKAKESEGAFKEAEEAYEKAESWEDVVRINLSNFDNL
jgi:WD repeat-containing protein 19